MNLFTCLKESLRNLFTRPPAIPTIPVPFIDEDGLVWYAEIPVAGHLPEIYDLINPLPKKPVNPLPEKLVTPLPEKLEGAGDFFTCRYRLHDYHCRGQIRDVYVNEQVSPEKLRGVIQRLIEDRKRLEIP